MVANIALCASLPLPAELPLRLVVVPAKNPLKGRDGRKWTVKDRQAILAQLNGAPVLLDENHASALAAPAGGKSPACGWFSDFKWTPDGLNAAIEWTPYGRELFEKKAYRYLSPALNYEVGSGNDTLGNVVGLHSVALTNHPNLDLPALNAAQKTSMDEKTLTALGLAADATQEQIVARITELDAQAKAPKADSVLTELKAAFGSLVEQVKGLVEASKLPEPALNAADAHKLALNSILDGAVAAGKIAPAAREAFANMAKDAAGLAALAVTVKALPVTSLNSETPKPTPGKKVLTGDQKKIQAAFGLKDEDMVA